MQKIILAIFIFAIIITSCNKEQVQSINEFTNYTKTNQVKRNRQVAGPYIRITGKLHSYAKIKKGPNKGGDCGCEHCFGLCDFDVEVGWEANALVTIPNSTTGRIYLIKNLLYKDDLFKVGSDITVPSELLSEMNYQNVTVLEGDYHFIEHEEIILVDGIYTLSYGYVDVNLETN